MKISGVDVSESDWRRPVDSDLYVKQLTWSHITTSAVTHECLPQNFYSTCSALDDNGKDVAIEEGVTILRRYVEDARKGKGYLVGHDRIRMIAWAVYDVVKDAINESLSSEDGIDIPYTDIEEAVRLANDSYESAVANYVRLGGNISNISDRDWMIPIVPMAS